MKIVVLLFASLFSVGFAYTEAVKEVKPEAVVLHSDIEVPVLHVMLDTVEIVAIPVALASAN